MRNPNRVLARLLALATGLSLLSCASTKKEEEDDKPEGIAGLEIRAPKSEDEWRSVRTAYAQFYITSKHPRYDEDLIGAFVEIVPLMRPAASEEELLTYVQSSGAAQDASLFLEDLMGKTVIRYQEERPRVTNPTRFRKVFNLGPRPNDIDYVRNTKGIFFCHPHDPKLAIKVGIWRNSYHGQIGEHFEAIAADFAASFLVANGLAGSAQ